MGSAWEEGVGFCLAPASQDSSHVGNAGVGVVSLRGAPISLPGKVWLPSGLPLVRFPLMLVMLVLGLLA